MRRRIYIAPDGSGLEDVTGQPYRYQVARYPHSRDLALGALYDDPIWMALPTRTQLARIEGLRETGAVMTKPCKHDWIRYVLDDSAASHEQQTGLDERGRRYRDIPIWPSATFAYAATIGSDFAARVVEMTCRNCGAAFDADMARVSDPRPRKNNRGH